jgi:hypothetical protein
MSKRSTIGECRPDICRHVRRLELTFISVIRTSKNILPAPEASLPAETPVPQLLTHLTYKEPVKLALARDFPLIVKRLEKTERGIRKMTEAERQAEKDKGPNGPLHQGLAWLHYREWSSCSNVTTEGSLVWPSLTSVMFRGLAVLCDHSGILPPSGLPSF